MSNAVAATQWAEQYPMLAQRGIDESMWNALCSTLYPGARTDSIIMAVDYCRARQLDIMLKPVHLVPMQVKDAQSGKKDWRDVPMPGIGLYRIQADRSGNYAGADEPEFGPTVEREFQGHDFNKNPITVKVAYPEWCKYTVYKIVSGMRVAYTSKEYWIENYATAGASSEAPNAMWKKRPFGQLAKCAEAQALRKAWPEIGSEPTAEEMEGKHFAHAEKDITPQAQPQAQALPHYPAESFDSNFPAWRDLIESGKKTPEQVIKMVSSKAELTTEQKNAILNLASQEAA
ncbi:MAG: phage recombination protein Bet [Acidobacteria bacterium]|nr:phage recombination protein Bet [Acidobacteriota bacterium]